MSIATLDQADRQVRSFRPQTGKMEFPMKHNESYRTRLSEMPRAFSSLESSSDMDMINKFLAEKSCQIHVELLLASDADHVIVNVEYVYQDGDKFENFKDPWLFAMGIVADHVRANLAELRFRGSLPDFHLLKCTPNNSRIKVTIKYQGSRYCRDERRV